MTIKMKSLLIDTKAEREGEWIDIKEWAGLDPDKPWEITKTAGLRFHVRSINDPAYLVARQKMMEDLEARRKGFSDEIIPQDIIDATEGKLLAERLLLGWEGLDEKYSSKAAAELLPMPEARPFREMIIFCASKVGRRKVEFVEGAEKNSEEQQSGL